VARRRLLYIGGWGRSGSSVLANVLGSHARIASLGEVRYVWDRGVLEDKRCGCGEPFSACAFWQRVLETAQVGADAKFAAAQAEVKALTRRPDNEDMLRLYALYKQGSAGDATGDRPGAFDMINRAKYDAWAKLKGTASDKAKQDYVKLVERLKKTYG